jgi:hypothetical protein
MAARRDQLVDFALANPVNVAVLDRLAALDLPDAWLVSGCVFQPVWNALTGRDPAHGIADYDLFYFDPDPSYEAEDAFIRRCAAAFAGIDAEIQVRNQARVHLWYPEKFGRPYPPLANTPEALTRFLAPCCAVALRKGQGGYEVAAPFGLDDLFAMIVRPNPGVPGSSAQYDAKAARWKACWPELTVLPWPD